MRTLMFLTILAIMTTMANANPVDTVTTWFQNEKAKIVSYQQSNWQKAKEQNANNMKKIKSFFSNLTKGNQ